MGGHKNDKKKGCKIPLPRPHIITKLCLNILQTGPECLMLKSMAETELGILCIFCRKIVDFLVETGGS